MRLLVIGAGASYAECKAAGLPEELCLPLLKNLSRTLWKDFNPTPFLEAFLIERGHAILGDAPQLFFELEKNEPALIEHFFAFAWRHRNDFFTPFGRCWDNLLYHGLLTPLNLVLICGLLKDNPQERVPLSETVAAKLTGGDAVLNLNYDLIFDVALRNIGKRVTYSPHARTDAQNILMFKPHGSFHLAVDEANSQAYFGQVRFIGDVQPTGSARTFLGFVPPRVKKSFADHPIANMMIAQLVRLKPSIVTFWGVGSPESDVDLFEVYRILCASGGRLEYVNPSDTDKARFESRLGTRLAHYRDAKDWLTDKPL